MTVFSRRPRADPGARTPPAWVSGRPAVAVTVTDSAGAPIAGARVCLQKGDDDYQVALTDANGVATSPFAPSRSAVCN